jgi:hypothetical protein
VLEFRFSVTVFAIYDLCLLLIQFQPVFLQSLSYLIQHLCRVSEGFAVDNNITLTSDALLHMQLREVW